MKINFTIIPGLCLGGAYDHENREAYLFLLFIGVNIKFRKRRKENHYA